MQYDLILVQQITVGVIPCAPVLFPRDEDFQRGMSGRGGGKGGTIQSKAGWDCPFKLIAQVSFSALFENH